MDDFTIMQEAAFSLHEMYESLVEAGFNEEQALYLTGQAMTANIKGQ